MEENNHHTKDGNTVATHLSNMSSTAKSVGRNLVYSIIASSWTMSYINNAFVPSKEIKWALVLALIYLFMDLTYYVLTTALYKYILCHYFDSTRDGDFVYKPGKDASDCTRIWMHFGFAWLIIMCIIMIISSVLMIIHVLNIQIPIK